MRFKFRAFYKRTNTMLSTDKIESINFETKTIGVYMEMDGRGFHKLRLSDFEVMQWTGLKDKNGVDIYEGDILHVLEVSNTKDLEYVSKVEFIDSGYLVTEPSGTQVPLGVFHNSDNSYPLFEIEIIGNIYENPELLGRTANDSTAILSESEAE